MQFTSVDTGLILKLTGFNQHLSKYLETLLKVMCDFPITEDGLDAWKQELKDDYYRELSNTRNLIRFVIDLRKKNVEVKFNNCLDTFVFI